MLFERYADDVICHCDSEAEAQTLLADLKARMAQCRLELHPVNTQVVYCVDANRHGDFAVKRFDFLGNTFKPRRAKNRRGELFIRFSPAVSDKAAKAMRQEMRDWGLSSLSRYDLGELLARLRPKIVGWVRYYGLFHPSTLQRSLKTLEFHLVGLAQRKYKRLRGHISKAWDWLSDLQKRSPMLFPHWDLVRRMTGR